MTLEDLKKQRSNTKKSLSRIKSMVEASESKEGKVLTSSDLKCRLGILEAYFKQILTTQASIEQLDPEDAQRGDIEEIYVAARVSIQNQLAEFQQNETFHEPSPAIPIQKIPPVKLPTFDGKYSEYTNFITTFNQIVDKEWALSKIEKYNHLIECLKGPALETIKAFPITEANYSKALERLKQRYDNTTLIFLDNISQLFNLPTVSKGNAAQLRSLVDNASALFGSLSSIGNDKEIAQAMLIHLITGKVDDQAKRKWKESLDFKTLPTWEKFSSVLERHCQYLESFNGGRSNETRKQETNTKAKNQSQQQQSNKCAFACSTSTCALCSSSEHSIWNCAEFNGMEHDKRYETTKRLGLCLNCLKKGHLLNKCPSSSRCKTCSKNHHSTLHRGSDKSQSASTPTQETSSKGTKNASTSSSAENLSRNSNEVSYAHTHLKKSSSEQVLLATAVILVKDSSGCYKLGRALLDSCSQVNFMTENFQQKLRLPKEKGTMEIRSIGNAHTNTKHQTSTTIKSRFNEFEVSLKFCVTSHIAYQPDSEIDIENWNLPQNTQMADEQFYKSGRIDLLLGTESFFSILKEGQIKLAPNLPILQRTLLGWVVTGSYNHQANAKSTFCTIAEGNEPIDIDKRLEKLWKLEELTTKPDPWTAEQHDCEEHFLKNVHRESNGRMTVRLPFKENPSCLGESYESALRRFVALENRFQKSPELRMQYTAFMDEYEKLGHMSIVKNPDLRAPHFYIPHHCVFKPTSTSTKIRVVFDASAKTTSQKSLNDILMVGPTVQKELFLLLIQFRLHRYALTADIIKMYRQVVVHHEDRKFQYILWRKSSTEKLCTYALNTVTYGTASAPYLAVRSLTYLADQFDGEFTKGSAALKSSFYVDDFLGGAESIEELHRIKYELNEILRRGGFELAKWHSNHLESVDDKTIKNLNLDADSITSALGLDWDQKCDSIMFSFRPKAKVNTRVTKRTILSLSSSLFDPLGLVSPLIIKAKLILQELWLLKLQWDDPIPEDLKGVWKSFIADLETLPEVRIPRYCLLPGKRSIQLHGFSDASIRAYGCCLYCRVEDEAGNISSQLLVAKSRVAPTKKQTLPKLELCGAVLLARLVAKIVGCFEGETVEVFLWCDSQIVLHWLKQHSATLSVFVGNRVSEMQDLSADATWKYVPTRHNPADIVSRGSSVFDLKNSIWFYGPSFLKEPQSMWPEPKEVNLDMEAIDAEKRKSAFKATTTHNYLLEKLEAYSSYTKSLRVVALMYKFFGKTHERSKHDYPFKESTISSWEMQIAKHWIIWNLQEQYFAEEIRVVKAQKTVSGSLKFLSPILKTFSGHLLLCVGGRLENASIPEEKKHPILLPGNASFVHKYVRHLHIKNYHAGPKALIGLIRLEYWIVNARKIARQIVRSCVHCVRYKPKLLQQMMANLPVERLTASRPFSRCGIDFFGPVNTYLRIRGRAPYKTYVAVFICLASKAVHFEVVSDLSTNAFIAALKRMIGRRGLPSDIYCDNATNFVGACNKLRELKQFLFDSNTKKSLVEFCSNEFINFHFIPPRALHFGGLWEAAVKSAKGHLQRSLMNARPTFEELCTAIVDIESILNSRPIAPLSSDPNDLGALTPAHFIIGSSLKSLPEASTSETYIDTLGNWTRITALKQHFWHRWSHEYIHELQSRSKWTQENPNICKGAMVVIHDDNAPPQRWALGRIEEIIPGPDSKIRVVDVRTAKGILRRPIHKLALLPA